MSRLILYPGGVSSADVSDDKIVRAVALSTEFKVFNFNPRPDLILDGRYQLGAENDQIELPGFVQAAVGGVMNAEYGVKTLFDSGGHTYFKLIAGDKFQANIFDAGQIEGIIPFEWSGRETIAFLLQFDGDVKFYLYYDGIVYSFSQAGESPDQSNADMSLISGRYERLDSFSSVSDVMSELEYLMKGTTLSGSSVENPAAFRAYEVYVLSDDGQINDENKTADFIDLGLTSDKMYAGFAGMKTTVNGRTLIDKLHDLSGNKNTVSFTGNNRPELFGNSICVEKASTNLFLNSDTLSTQGVTVTADPYTVSIEGTGSITFSGVHTGTLQGVSGQRVSVTFTPTAGTLTCTVSGTVTKAQIEKSTYATLYIPTAGTPVTRAQPAAMIPNTKDALCVMFWLDWQYVSDEGSNRVLDSSLVNGTFTIQAPASINGVTFWYNSKSSTKGGFTAGRYKSFFAMNVKDGYQRGYYGDSVGIETVLSRSEGLVTGLGDLRLGGPVSTSYHYLNYRITDPLTEEEIHAYYESTKPFV